MTQRLQSYLGYSYPTQLTDLVRRSWPTKDLSFLPNEVQLRLAFDVAYQASLLLEEQRAVTFRVLLASPEDLLQVTNGSLTALPFDRSRPFNEQEVRRLSSAADFFRSMIAVCPDPDYQLRIWGILLTGTRWVNPVDGGRFSSIPLPSRLVVHARGPGRLTAFIGNQRIATLTGGTLEGNAFDLFQSEWLSRSFVHVRKKALKMFFAESEGFPFVPLDQSFLRTMSQNVLRRTLSVVRDAKHGGTLVFIEPEDEAVLARVDGPLRFKYRFAAGNERARYRVLVQRAMFRLLQLAQEHQITEVGWEDYQNSNDRQLSEMDESLFDLAHFLGDLMSVDGAVILTKLNEVVGFGAELLAKAPHLTSVRHALDVEATIWSNEDMEDVGTRHRAVYRLCEHNPECVAIVISQDGSIRFVKRHNGAVTYWNQVSW